MDIYSFLRSRGVADYCRNIGKVWNTLEMAVIVARSVHPIDEKHKAWQELIDEYPDMPAHYGFYETSFDSIHQKLRDINEFGRYRPWQHGGKSSHRQFSCVHPGAV